MVAGGILASASGWQAAHGAQLLAVPRLGRARPHPLLHCLRSLALPNLDLSVCRGSCDGGGLPGEWLSVNVAAVWGLGQAGCAWKLDGLGWPWTALDVFC